QPRQPLGEPGDEHRVAVVVDGGEQDDAAGGEETLVPVVAEFGAEVVYDLAESGHSPPSSSRRTRRFSARRQAREDRRTRRQRRLGAYAAPHGRYSHFAPHSGHGPHLAPATSLGSLSASGRSHLCSATSVSFT